MGFRPSGLAAKIRAEAQAERFCRHGGAGRGIPYPLGLGAHDESTHIRPIDSGCRSRPKPARFSAPVVRAGRGGSGDRRFGGSRDGRPDSQNGDAEFDRAPARAVRADRTGRHLTRASGASGRNLHRAVDGLRVRLSRSRHANLLPGRDLHRGMHGQGWLLQCLDRQDRHRAR